MKKIYYNNLKRLALLIMMLISASWAWAETSASKPSGEGTQASPYLIANLANLRWLSDNSSAWAADLYYEQTADIDASETASWNSGQGFMQIGFNGSYGFGGHYDGKGHIIANLTINRSDNYIGLFASIKSGATVSNLGLSGTITGSIYTGGFVGSNSGTITNCYAIVTVSGDGNSGGFVGINDRNSGNIEACYAVANVLKGNGAFVGYELGNTKDCYYDKDVCTKNAVGAGENDGVTGKTTAELSNGTFKPSNAFTASAGYYPMLTGSDMEKQYAFVPVTLSITGLTASKVYDGTTTASVVYSGATLDGKIDGEEVSLDATNATATYNDANAGTGKTVTVTGLALTGANASKYKLPASVTLTGEITTRPVTVKAVDQTITYGDAPAAYSYECVAETEEGKGLVSGESLSGITANCFAVITNSQGRCPAGNYPITVTTTDGENLNYAITPQDGTLTINKITLGVANVTVASKEYDATTAATLTAGEDAAVYGVLDGDDVSASFTGQFADANAGEDKAVIMDAPTGTDASNYEFTSASGLKATITAKQLTLSGTPTASDKVYDGTTVATINTTDVTVSGFIDADATKASFVWSDATFADANVGEGKAVTLNGSITGEAASNYALPVFPTDLTASITQRPVVIIPYSNQSKTYTESDPTFEYTTSTGENAGLVSGATLDGALGRVAGEDASDYAYTLGTLVESNPNYNISLTADNIAHFTINKRELTVEYYWIKDKLYEEGNTDVIIETGNMQVYNKKGGDDVSVSMTGKYADDKVGDNKPITITLTLSGAQAGNYWIAPITGKTASIVEAVDFVSNYVHYKTLTAHEVQIVELKSSDVTQLSFPNPVNYNGKYYDVVSPEGQSVSAIPVGLFKNAGYGSNDKALTLLDLSAFRIMLSDDDLAKDDDGNYSDKSIFYGLSDKTLIYVPDTTANIGINITNMVYCANDNKDHARHTDCEWICADYQLNDAFAQKYGLQIPHDFTAEKVSYDRTFTAGTGENTFCTVFLPFSVKSEGNGTFYNVNSVSETKVNAAAITEASTLANRAYLYKPSTEGSKFVIANYTKVKATDESAQNNSSPYLKGVYSNLSANTIDNCFVYAAQPDAISGAVLGGFVKAGPKAWIPTGRAYLLPSENRNAKANFFSINIEGVTSVNGIEAAAESAQPAYNISGQRVDRHYRGIVIKNGKKAKQ